MLALGFGLSPLMLILKFNHYNEHKEVIRALNEPIWRYVVTGYLESCSASWVSCVFYVSLYNVLYHLGTLPARSLLQEVPLSMVKQTPNLLHLHSLTDYSEDLSKELLTLCPGLLPHSFLGSSVLDCWKAGKPECCSY